MRVTLLILIILLCSALPAFAEPLKGNVEEDLTLDQWERDVLPTIKAGVLWNDSMLPRQRTEEVWFWVPPWKAGELQGDMATEYEFKDGKPSLSGVHKNRFDLLSGQQRDAQGGIWHCARFPNVSTVETDERLVTVIGMASSHLQRAPDEEIVKERAIEISRNKDTGTIVSVREVLSRAKWTPQEDGTLLFIQQTLGQDDKPSKEGRLIVGRVAPFRKVDSLPDGFDLNASLRGILLSRGMRDLIPQY